MQPAHLDAERHEALLRAVVEISLETASLLVARFDDPDARRLDLGELEPHLDAEARHLDRERGGREDAVQEVVSVEKRRVMEQHGRQVAVPIDIGSRAIVIG